VIVCVCVCLCACVCWCVCVGRCDITVPPRVCVQQQTPFVADFVAYVAAQLREKLSQDDSKAQIDNMARASLVRRLLSSPSSVAGKLLLPQDKHMAHQPQLTKITGANGCGGCVFFVGQQQARRRGFVKEVIVERKSLLEKLRATGSLPAVLDFKAQRDEVRRTRRRTRAHTYTHHMQTRNWMAGATSSPSSPEPLPLLMPSKLPIPPTYPSCVFADCCALVSGACCPCHRIRPSTFARASTYSSKCTWRTARTLCCPTCRATRC
jgi:hypothetical protein